MAGIDVEQVLAELSMPEKVALLSGWYLDKFLTRNNVWNADDLQPSQASMAGIPLRFLG